MGLDRVTSDFEQFAANEEPLSRLSVLFSIYAPIAAPIGAFVSPYKLKVETAGKKSITCFFLFERIRSKKKYLRMYV